MAMSMTAKLSKKFRISIPNALREQLSWRAGREVVFIAKGKGVLVMPAPSRDEMLGLAEGTDRDGYCDRGERI